MSHGDTRALPASTTAGYLSKLKKIQHQTLFKKNHVGEGPPILPGSFLTPLAEFAPLSYLRLIINNGGFDAGWLRRELVRDKSYLGTGKGGSPSIRDVGRGVGG